MVNENNTGAVTLGPSYIVTNSHQFDNYWSFFVASMRHVPIVAVNCQSMHVSNIPGVVHAHDDGDESKVCGTHAQQFLLLSRITRNISTTPTWSVPPMTVHGHVLMAQLTSMVFIDTFLVALFVVDD
jgi:hypothetical protein